MSMLVASFWEGLFHATAFAMLGIVVYFASRRLSPAAGALAAGSSLCVMAMVAILAFCPWPRWGSGRSFETLRSAIVDSRPPRRLNRRWNCPLPDRQCRHEAVPGGRGVGTSRLSLGETVVALWVLRTLAWKSENL